MNYWIFVHAVYSVPGCIGVSFMDTFAIVCCRYLGRKRLKYKEEEWVKGAKTLIWPHYSYWTLSYILSYRGATKLLAQKPLSKMVPVDEYLPIMFNQHPT